MNRVAKPSSRHSKKSGSVRIISGQWRGRRLPVLDAEGLRPSTDRTRETLFNWLMAHVQGSRVLDVFAGSGVLGLEALSRYASESVFIEKQTATANQLKANLATLKTNAQVYCADALSVLPQLKTPFDIIFIDPPFGHNLVNPALAALYQHGLLADNALIYVEQEANGPAIEMPPGCEIIKQKHTGQLAYCLIQFSVS
ncbi:16S rRNA (guanine(966)-N(2))-methyltransferase RsmD [Alteromonas lipolytica]|uniref:Ribosomal RNA small subunit methyltransferase D n=1 Tax=Alteromonas lipolytica TaxID=1856405 RepID=A0A1E8FJM9_9ALTE|nr:16S rRNA (guanine(966)-N(2))-methyltransferase RsmD [Alteromonas lipolytica]OFI36124.1 16S rRNA (guanine(966)-N(2))-methyltransferase RsmD [Alteromonas lipolytica]GGF86123.1 ribosomal RNA small subunit methyltransferase D [Alteromonas lipolytica]